MKNVGGRDAGAITAAQFIQRFIKKDMPWIHIDIAGALHIPKSESTFAPAGATGWGVMSLNRLVSEKYENNQMSEVFFYHLTQTRLRGCPSKNIRACCVF